VSLKSDPTAAQAAHRTLTVLLVALTLVIALLLLAWTQSQHLFKARSALVQTQLSHATSLVGLLNSPGLTNAAESTADRMRRHSQQLWQANWELFNKQHTGFVNDDPALNRYYDGSPHRLRERIERIADLTGTDDLLQPLSLRLLKNEANMQLLESLQNVLSEIDIVYARKNKPVRFIAWLLIPAILFFLLAKHYLIFMPVFERGQQKAQALDQAQERLDFLSSRDPLTDTSNRRAITAFLSDFQRSNQRDGEFIALAVFDIDHFQQINDVFGYFAGDAVLKEMAIRIQDELRAEDQLGRTEADRFLIVLCGLVAPRAAEAIIHRIQEIITRPVAFKDNVIDVTCTVGASVQEVSTLDLGELFKLSDQALQRAKSHRRGSVLLMSDQAQAALSRQREIVNAMNDTPPEDLFDLVFQPIVTLTDERIVGCECLLRWTAEQPVEVTTDELIPILEMYGSIHTVGHWVFRHAFEHLTQWLQDYPGQPLFLSINVSAQQLEIPDFPEQIVALSQEYNIPPEHITLELTETTAIKHHEAGRKQLALFRNYGFGISLDDFGTGYSSLSHLKTMPVSTVKIDQSFIREMNIDSRDEAIVDSAIRIAAAIGLQVVAEGIDTPEQLHRLQQTSCDYGQGYLFSKPLTASEFRQRLSAQQLHLKSG